MTSSGLLADTAESRTGEQRKHQGRYGWVRARCGRALVLVVGIAAMLTPPALAAPRDFGQSVEPVATDDVIFDWATQRCPGDTQNFPDTPPDPYRWPDGTVEMLFAHAGDKFDTGTFSGRHTRRFRGPSIYSLALDCTGGPSADGVVHISHKSLNPSMFNSREWIHAPYILPSGGLIAMVNNDFHGYELPDRETNPNGCTISANGFSFDEPPFGPLPEPACWMNSLTLASWTGSSFGHAAAPAHLVVAPPYKYDEDVEGLPAGRDQRAYGYQFPSNIVRKSDGFYYALFKAASVGGQFEPQRRGTILPGTCVMRTQTPGNQASWKTWTGAGGWVRLQNPYDPADGDDKTACLPLNPDPEGPPFNRANFKLGQMTGNLSYNSYLDRYMVVSPSLKDDPLPPDPGPNKVAFYYSLSPDLMNWSERQILMEINQTVSCDFEGKEVFKHPAVIDHASADPNFGTTSNRNYLYFVRKTCHLAGTPAEVSGYDRDLIRIPIQWKKTKATDNGYACPGGFDDRETDGSPSHFVMTSDPLNRGYDGIKAFKAEATLTDFAYGVLDRAFDPTGGPPSSCEVGGVSGDSRPGFNYREGDWVFWQGAFRFPGQGAGGFWSDLAGGQVTVMELGNPSVGRWAGRFKVSGSSGNGKLHFTTNDGTEREVLLDPANGTPGIPFPTDDCWHLLQAYQQLGPLGTATNLIYVDGVLVVWSSHGNFQTGSTTSLNTIRAGIVEKSTASAHPTLYTDVVGWGDADRPPYTPPPC